MLPSWTLLSIFRNTQLQNRNKKKNTFFRSKQLVISSKDRYFLNDVQETYMPLSKARNYFRNGKFHCFVLSFVLDEDSWNFKWYKSLEFGDKYHQYLLSGEFFFQWFCHQFRFERCSTKKWPMQMYECSVNVNTEYSFSWNWQYGCRIEYTNKELNENRHLNALAKLLWK